MIELNKEYEVYDYQKRYWGNVIFIKVFQNAISGYLKPKSDFDLVRKLFSKFQETTSEVERDLTSELIAKLEVSFVNLETGEITKPGIVFVNENYLLTCAC